jgi:hypothetical protein
MMHCAVLFVRHGHGHIEKVAVAFNSLHAHAETEVMRAWLRQSRVRKIGDHHRLELLVWRIRHGGTYANSKPCWNCVQALRRLDRRGLCPRNIWYTREVEHQKSPAAVVLSSTTIDCLLHDPQPHVRCCKL